MNFPAELKYSKSHEWVKDCGGGRYEVGISDYAQGELGDVVFVNLPEPGESLSAGATFAYVESVKSVSDLYSPLDGEVEEVNDALNADPGLINSDPYGAFIIKAKGSVGEELMSAADYEQFVASEG
jgi:glycine cleavage system H protein